MNSQRSFQSIKRFMAAIALTAFLLVGGLGVAPANTESQEAATSVVAFRNGFLDDLPTFVPQGNFWSG